MASYYTLSDIAAAINGHLVGDGSYKVTAVAHPAAKAKGGDLVLATDPALMPLLEANGACVAILSAQTEVPSFLKGAILVGRSRYAMAHLTGLFEKKVVVAPGVHPSAVLEEGVEIDPTAAIGAFSYIARGARIGRGTVIHPQVYIGPEAEVGEEGLIYSGVRIGARVKIGARAIIHFNTTIGADGFSFVTPDIGSVETAKATGEVGSAQNLQLVRIASLGAVEIGDNVEIGANTSIDRGTIVSTRIGRGTKIDNQVQIGHNVVVGENCMLCGRVGIAGSSEIGNRVVLGGSVGVADHVKVGDDTVAMGMSGIAGNIPPRSLVGGAPAKPRKKFIQDLYNISRIKGLAEKVQDLSQRLDALDGGKE
ncbi:MAG: UDP-3-O-(3-hydroxymyristoyl)glucosamine N-acyltransferase [Proteobacteria bacterium]|nr:UDP-3-O-(3-hydroxymyristoyl)glucosamine N-acyltransferase [Alphaproteobacteria bacterium]NCC02804.1 UDP-3-O-(3-hydroxymyristoyl)glucosamine N-acyltransferase [Pseudomonadota bacterium]